MEKDTNKTIKNPFDYKNGPSIFSTGKTKNQFNGVNAGKADRASKSNPSTIMLRKSGVRKLYP